MLLLRYEPAGRAADVDIITLLMAAMAPTVWLRLRAMLRHTRR